MLLGYGFHPEGDPGRRHRFFRRFRAPRMFRNINLHRFRGLGSALGTFGIPGADQLAMLTGDPGKGRALSRRHARAGKAHKLRRVAKHAGAGIAGFLSGAASFAEQHPGLAGFLKGEAGSIPFVGGGLQSIAQQTFAGPGGESPTLDDAAEATGLPPDHPHTRKVHALMGGRRRRMNFANPKALRRSVSRLTSFVRHYKRAASHLGYTLHRGHAARGMTHRRKRA